VKNELRGGGSQFSRARESVWPTALPSQPALGWILLLALFSQSSLE